MGHVVWHKIVAQAVALIGGAPKLARDRIDGLANAIANSPCVDFLKLAFGCELQNVGAMKFFGMRVAVVHVGVGADRRKELAAVFRKDNVARPVSATAQSSAAGKFRKFRTITARFEV